MTMSVATPARGKILHWVTNMLRPLWLKLSSNFHIPCKIARKNWFSMHGGLRTFLTLFNALKSANIASRDPEMNPHMKGKISCKKTAVSKCVERKIFSEFWQLLICLNVSLTSKPIRMICCVILTLVFSIFRTPPIDYVEWHSMSIYIFAKTKRQEEFSSWLQAAVLCFAVPVPIHLSIIISHPGVNETDKVQKKSEKPQPELVLTHSTNMCQPYEL